MIDFDCRMSAPDFSPLVFNTEKDRTLRLLFQSAAAHLIWELYLGDPDISQEDLLDILNQHFAGAIAFIQTKTISVVGAMHAQRFDFTHLVTSDDIAQFILNDVDLLKQLSNNVMAQNGLKCSLHAYGMLALLKH